jgi:hypothetical protein
MRFAQLSVIDFCELQGAILHMLLLERCPLTVPCVLEDEDGYSALSA